MHKQKLIKHNFSILCLCSGLLASAAQATTFKINQGSTYYDAVLSVATCERDECSGEAKISLYKKGASQVFQTLHSDDLNFYLDEKQKPSVNVIQLYNEQSPLIFDDFNFDGQQDLAIRNGNNSSYGGPSYDVYVFNKTRQKFMLSEELTTLASDNLGMFQTDHKRKRLTTFAKSGCCYHETTQYAVIPHQGLKKVYQLIEDAMDAEEKVKVTKRQLINNKWKVTVKKYNIKDYYGEQ